MIASLSLYQLIHPADEARTFTKAVVDARILLIGNDQMIISTEVHI